MNRYNCFSTNQLKIMFLMDGSRERERERGFNQINIKQTLF